MHAGALAARHEMPGPRAPYPVAATRPASGVNGALWCVALADYYLTLASGQTYVSKRSGDIARAHQRTGVAKTGPPDW